MQIRDSLVRVVIIKFEIYSPLQGDTYNVGDTIFIQWDKDVFLLNLAVISFSKGKVRYITHDEGIDSKSPQWGNLAWKIPDTISDTTIQQCYIQVADYENEQINCKSGIRSK